MKTKLQIKRDEKKEQLFAEIDNYAIASKSYANILTYCSAIEIEQAEQIVENSQRQMTTLFNELRQYVVLCLRESVKK